MCANRWMPVVCVMTRAVCVQMLAVLRDDQTKKRFEKLATRAFLVARRPDNARVILQQYALRDDAPSLQPPHTHTHT